ncbi:hypothetical protein IDM40_19815 [Nocardiopsis sp. HNM0947]|uniref:Secreted protein n=1 Tax=Nocardiopsis coralli TaxID=2772213 RepID=A0ABR9PAQ6_9ACTN|nr:hypothetical protein [Nocardiopsis coralli]MBE3000921.1 hypothetical protein [Nocardiopsis coralli]
MKALKRIPRTRLVATAAGLTVLALSAAWFLWPEPGPDDHRTNPDALSMAISQDELDEIPGLHTHVEGKPVTDVVGTAHGALLVLDNGVVAVSDEQWEDQRKGDWPEQWRYLDDSPLTGVHVLPGGHLTALVHGRPGEDEHTITLLDGRTGAIEGSTELGDSFAADDELHISTRAVLQQSGQTLTAHPVGEDGQTLPPDEKPTWSVTTDELCPSVTEPADTSTAPGIVPTVQGFMVSQRCAEQDDGPQTHVLSHLHDMVSPGHHLLEHPEDWSHTWQYLAPETPRMQVHYMSPAIIPDSPDDVVTDLLDADNTTPYALALEARLNAHERPDDPVLFEPSLFQDWDPDGYFTEPLLDEGEYPEALVIAESLDVDAHVSMQSAKTVEADPEVDFDRENTRLQRRVDGAWVEPETYRAFNSMNFRFGANHLIQQTLP